MPGNTLFFITASLLVAKLGLALPDLELEAVAEEPVKGGTMRGMAGAPRASSAAETKP